ncbi:MAG: 50S ribosomal protein L29 [Nitrospirae bacterium]|jgi:large subunit ribosomal protein L29|nr:50S ribosomal protein L29 [Nitrospirota bacterium]
MKIAETRGMSLEELAQREGELRKELFNLRFQKATGEILNPRRISGVKRDIARIHTVRTEKAG